MFPVPDKPCGWLTRGVHNASAYRAADARDGADCDGCSGPVPAVGFFAGTGFCWRGAVGWCCAGAEADAYELRAVGAAVSVSLRRGRGLEVGGSENWARGALGGDAADYRYAASSRQPETAVGQVCGSFSSSSDTTICKGVAMIASRMASSSASDTGVPRSSRIPEASGVSISWSNLRAIGASRVLILGFNLDKSTLACVPSAVMVSHWMMGPVLFVAFTIRATLAIRLADTPVSGISPRLLLSSGVPEQGTGSDDRCRV